MEYRQFGRTGVRVSELCLGCMMFGGRTEEEDSFEIIDRAIDSGINFIDTANVYSRGASEEVVGRALKRNGRRDQIVLATKVHGTMNDEDPNAGGNHRRHIIEQCEASLMRLQTDYIDLYQIHRPSSEVPIDETLGALDDLVRAGKVRYIGTSTYAAWQLVESLWASKELRLNRFVSEQPPYHLLDRRIERELVPFAQTYGTALIPWSPLAGGFLTGKYSRGEDSPEDSRYGIEPRRLGRNHFTDEAFDVLETVEEIAKENDCTPGQLALAWCKDRPAVTSPIIGPRTLEQLEDNLGAVEVSFSEKDHERLDQVAPPGRAIVPYYEADFGPHQFRW
ncbi:MAG: aldo/keto reductase [Rubrobacteraceae bacterium]